MYIDYTALMIFFVIVFLQILNTGKSSNPVHLFDFVLYLENDRPKQMFITRYHRQQLTLNIVAVMLKGRKTMCFHRGGKKERLHAKISSYITSNAVRSGQKCLKNGRRRFSGLRLLDDAGIRKRESGPCGLLLGCPGSTNHRRFVYQRRHKPRVG